VSESPLSGTVAPGTCQTVTVTFDATGLTPGDYFADLLIESNDPDEPVITLPMTMTVDEPANIVDVTYLATDLVVAFTSTVAGTPPIDYLWDFGDGVGTSTETNPIYTYAAGGCYSVSLDIANACGMDSWVGQVCVCDPLHDADFSWNPVSPLVGEVVYFTATAAGTNPTYAWDLGDGTFDTGEFVNHAYAAAGTYTVIMTATGDCGGPLVVTYDITVYAGCVPVSGADFSWAPNSPIMGEVVQFTGTVAAGTAPMTYTWDFGDGNAGSGQYPTHAYAAAGTYTVLLTVTNECGEDYATYDIVVVEGCVAPTGADFSWLPLNPNAGQPVAFTGSTTGGTVPITYAWAFGDGGTGAGSPINHTYALSGTYTVVMTATNACGFDVATYDVTVSEVGPVTYAIYLPIIVRP
jgi:PKD repeat protein